MQGTQVLSLTFLANNKKRLLRFFFFKQKSCTLIIIIKQRAMTVTPVFYLQSNGTAVTVPSTLSCNI